MSWNWTIRGRLGSHHGSKRSDGSDPLTVTPLPLTEMMGGCWLALLSFDMLMLAVEMTVGGFCGFSSDWLVRSLVKTSSQSSCVRVGGWINSNSIDCWCWIGSCWVWTTPVCWGYLMMDLRAGGDLDSTFCAAQKGDWDTGAMGSQLMAGDEGIESASQVCDVLGVNPLSFATWPSIIVADGSYSVKSTLCKKNIKKKKNTVANLEWIISLNEGIFFVLGTSPPPSSPQKKKSWKGKHKKWRL